jgi:hypothetical protein
MRKIGCPHAIQPAAVLSGVFISEKLFRPFLGGIAREAFIELQDAGSFLEKVPPRGRPVSPRGRQARFGIERQGLARVDFWK